MPTIDMNIDVHHMARVEGHGDIRIQVKGGRLVAAQWAVVETPRFFEAILRGKSHDMAPVLTSRICGICSISHTLTSLRAVERALGIDVPRTARLARLLAKHGETLQSHILHVFFLAAPDFLGVDSVLPVIETQPEVARLAVSLKGLGNDICAQLAGRTTHPVALIVGGISKAPERSQLEILRQRIQNHLPDMLKAIELFKTVSLPRFERETEFVSLRGIDSYPWIGGDLVSSDGVRKAEDDYLAMTNEYNVGFSTSKHARLSRESYAVGALARFNNNHRFLRPEAKEVADVFGLTPGNCNPFMHSIARLVESFHVMLEAMSVIEELLGSEFGALRAEYGIRSGEGVGAVEAPRGILYHHFKLDEQGLLTRANCIIPTTQNNGNIHLDLGELVKQQLTQGKDDQEIRLRCEMLVRAYDPCISCSVH